MKLPPTMTSGPVWHIHAGGAIGAIAVAAAAYVLVVGPAMGRGELVNQRRAQLASQQAELAALTASNKDAQTALAAAQGAVESGGLRLQTRDHLNQRLADLTQLATEHSLEIAQLAAGKSTDGARHGTVGIQLSGKGTYLACDSFLEACAEQFHDLAVISLTASSNPEIPQSPILLTLDMLWFIAPDRQPAAK